MTAIPSYLLSHYKCIYHFNQIIIDFFQIVIMGFAEYFLFYEANPHRWPNIEFLSTPGSRKCQNEPAHVNRLRTIEDEFNNFPIAMSLQGHRGDVIDAWELKLRPQSKSGAHGHGIYI